MLKKFRKWMNFNSPDALDMDGWNDFEDKFRKKASIRYFIKHEIIRRIERIYDRIGKLGWDIRYRTIRKYHLINTKLGPGYHDIDTRMLHGNFELLVDYVEIECANIETAFKPKERRAALGWRYHLPSILRFKEFRSRELGIKHLEWEMTLASPTLSEYDRNFGQARRAVQVVLLYTWWKEVYPNRQDLRYPDVEDDENSLRFLSAKWKKDNPDVSAKISQWSIDSFQLEQDWDTEDEEMLISLMKIRKGLWT